MSYLNPCWYIGIDRNKTRLNVYNIQLSYRWLFFAFSARSKLKRWRHTYVFEKWYSSKLLTKHNFPNDIEELFVEINFTKKQMVTFQNISPNLTKRSISFWLSWQSSRVYSSHEKVILTGDFNPQESECVFDSFLYQHDLTNLVKEGIC